MSIADFWDAALAVFSATDVIRLVILVVILLVAGLLMPSFGTILNATLVALVAFVVALYLRWLSSRRGGCHGARQADWNAFLA